MTGVGDLPVDMLDAMLEALPDELTLVGKDNTVLYYNRGGRRITKRSPDILGKNFVDCHSPGNMEKVEMIVSELRSGSREVYDFPFERDGHKMHTRYIAVRGIKGEYMGVLQVTREVPE